MHNKKESHYGNSIGGMNINYTMTITYIIDVYMYIIYTMYIIYINIVYAYKITLIIYTWT